MSEEIDVEPISPSTPDFGSLRPQSQIQPLRVASSTFDRLSRPRTQPLESTDQIVASPRINAVSKRITQDRFGALLSPRGSGRSPNYGALLFTESKVRQEEKERRIQVVVEERERKIAEEMEKECTFMPVISPESIRLAEALYGGQHFFDRIKALRDIGVDGTPSSWRSRNARQLHAESDEKLTIGQTFEELIAVANSQTESMGRLLSAWLRAVLTQQGTPDLVLLQLLNSELSGVSVSSDAAVIQRQYNECMLKLFNALCDSARVSVEERDVDRLAQTALHQKRCETLLNTFRTRLQIRDNLSEASIEAFTQILDTFTSFQIEKLGEELRSKLCTISDSKLNELTSELRNSFPTSEHSASAAALIDSWRADSAVPNWASVIRDISSSEAPVQVCVSTALLCLTLSLFAIAIPSPSSPSQQQQRSTTHHLFQGCHDLEVDSFSDVVQTRMKLAARLIDQKDVESAAAAEQAELEKKRQQEAEQGRLQAEQKAKREAEVVERQQQQEQQAKRKVEEQKAAAEAQQAVAVAAAKEKERQAAVAAAEAEKAKCKCTLL